jgi:DNA-binding NtrC family response regulator
MCTGQISVRKIKDQNNNRKISNKVLHEFVLSDKLILAVEKSLILQEFTKTRWNKAEAAGLFQIECRLLLSKFSKQQARFRKHPGAGF